MIDKVLSLILLLLITFSVVSTGTTFYMGINSPSEIHTDSTELIDDFTGIYRLNTSVKSVSFYTSASLYERFRSLAFLLNPDSNLDVSLVIRDNDENGSQIISTDNGGIGVTEGYVLQPISLDQISTGQLFIEINRISGEGEVHFNFDINNKSNIVSQDSNIATEIIEIDELEVLLLNYSSGAAIEVSIDNNNYYSNFTYELFLFGSNNDINNSHYYKKVQLNDLNGKTFIIDSPGYKSLGYDGLSLVIVGIDFNSTQSIDVQTNVGLDPINTIGVEKLSIFQSSNIFVLESNETKYYALEIGSVALAIDIISGVRMVNFQYSWVNNFSSTQIFSQGTIQPHDSSITAIQNYGEQVSTLAVGYTYIFIKITDISFGDLDQNSIQFNFKQDNTPNTISNDISQSISLSEDEFFFDFIELSPFPSDTIFWASPQSNLDIKIALYNQTTSELNSFMANEYGKGHTESLGSIYTGDVVLYLLIIKNLEGNGNLNYNIKRTFDGQDPVVSEINYSSELNINDSFSVDVTSSDNVGILNNTILIKNMNASNFQYLGSASMDYILEYGNYDFYIVSFDYSKRQTVFDNNGEYFQLSIKDNINPVISNVTFNFTINQNQNNGSLTIETYDEHSGLQNLTLFYELDNNIYNFTRTNITSSSFHFNISDLLPNKTIIFYFSIVDNENNALISDNYAYFLGLIEISTELSIINSANVTETITAQVEVISNIEITAVDLIFTLQSDNSSYTFTAFGNFNIYNFTITLSRSGNYSILIQVLSITNEIILFNLNQSVVEILDIVIVDPTDDGTSSISTTSLTTTSNENTNNDNSDNFIVLITAGGLISLLGLLAIRYNIRPKDLLKYLRKLKNS